MNKTRRILFIVDIINSLVKIDNIRKRITGQEILGTQVTLAKQHCSYPWQEHRSTCFSALISWLSEQNFVSPPDTKTCHKSETKDLDGWRLLDNNHILFCPWPGDTFPPKHKEYFIDRGSNINLWQRFLPLLHILKVRSYLVNNQHAILVKVIL